MQLAGIVSHVGRVLLRAMCYHVYYRVRGKDVIVLAVWNVLRGSGLDLTALP
ncbi:MAG: hypothetical protein AB1486_14165 [Planctomycetota bacterium]